LAEIPRARPPSKQTNKRRPEKRDRRHMTGKLKVLGVDDTVVYRKILSEVVGRIEGAEFVGTAPNGKIALAKLAQTPVDMVLLDIEMPEMDGVQTLLEIQKKHPEVGVIMVSGTNKSSADITIKALQAGALDFVQKPEGRDPEANIADLVGRLTPLFRQFSTRQMLRTGPAEAVAETPSKVLEPKATGRKPLPGPSEEPPRRPVAASPSLAPIPKDFEVVVIGVSTGGPNALGEVIPRLPAGLGVPVLVVQHMPPTFTASLAENLQKRSALPVREATQGEPVVSNTVLIAPGGKHMVVRRRTSPEGEQQRIIGLNENPPVNSCRPSVDVLFRSVALTYEGCVLSVIMTGMGDDGAEGVRALKRRGCLSLTQTADTCVVYGMPRAVDEKELSDERVPLPRIAQRIVRAVSR